MKMQVLLGASEKVRKYVFTYDDGAVVEAVLYRYPTYTIRTVLCISVSSGCQVGCKFCGTGSHFIRHLLPSEIVEQVTAVFQDVYLNGQSVKKLQIMFMSMGEPLLNWESVRAAIISLHVMYPNAELLISTIAPKVGWGAFKVMDSVIALASSIDKIGLQFSLHASTNEKRNRIIPYQRKHDISDLCEYGHSFYDHTGRRVYLNICVNDKFTAYDAKIIYDNFRPNCFAITLSVICSPNENMKESGYRDLDNIRFYERIFAELGYNTRVFDPEGQDDIGGGCGQLFHFQKLFQVKNDDQ